MFCIPVFGGDEDRIIESVILYQSFMMYHVFPLYPFQAWLVMSIPDIQQKQVPQTSETNFTETLRTRRKMPGTRKIRGGCVCGEETGDCMSLHIIGEEMSYPIAI